MATKKSSKEDKEYTFKGKTGIESDAMEKAFKKEYMKYGTSQGPYTDQIYQMALQAARKEAVDEIKRETKGKAPDAYAKGGAVTKKAFKPCEGCPTPAKCKAAGKCLAKEGKGKPMGIAIMIGVGKAVKPKKK
jgi:hypothetical protein